MVAARLFPPLFLLFLSITAARAGQFTDSAGRQVEIPDHIERAMPAGPPASVFLYVLAPEKMVGWVRPPSSQAMVYLLPSTRNLPVSGRLTGKDGSVDPKAIQALKPDVIVDVGDVTPAYAALADRVQSLTGVPYVLIDGSLTKSPETLRTLGQLLGVTDRAEPPAAYAAVVLEQTKALASGQDQAKPPRIYYAHNADGLETAPAGTINAEILAAAGAENVAVIPEAKGFATVSIDQIAAWNPDYILAVDRDFAKMVVSDPHWQSVAAVREDHVLTAPAEPFGWTDTPPSLNRLIGVQWLASHLYPVDHPVSFGRLVKDFYKLFYHIDLTSPQLQRLLVEAGVTD